MPGSPFVCLEGQWFIEPFEQQPSKEQLIHKLEALLQIYPPQDILLRRRMSPAEVRLFNEHCKDCLAEILSMVLAPAEAR